MFCGCAYLKRKVQVMMYECIGDVYNVKTGRGCQPINNTTCYMNDEEEARCKEEGAQTQQDSTATLNRTQQDSAGLNKTQHYCKSRWMAGWFLTKNLIDGT